MVLKPKRQLWVPSKPAIIVPNRRPIPVVRPSIIPARRIFPIRSAVTVDVTGTEQFKSAVTSFTYSGLTITGGLSNSALVVALVYSTGATTNATFSSPAWGAQSMSSIIQQDLGVGGTGVVLFGLVAPNSGAQNFTATASITVDCYVYGVSFAGVNQTGGTTTFAHSAGATSPGTTSLAFSGGSLTTANGNYTLVAAQVGTGDESPTPGQTIQLSGIGTQDWFDNTDPHVFGNFGAAGKAASTGTTAVWTAHNSASDSATMVGVDIVAGAAATIVEEDNSRIPRRYWQGWTPNFNLLRNTAQDFSSPGVETNPHWKPWTKPLQWTPTQLLRTPAVDVPPVVTPDTPPPFKPSTFPAQWFLNQRLFKTTAQDFSSFGVETNPHWVSKPWPVQWAPLSLLRATPNDAPAPVTTETNTFFIPRTFPLQWLLQPSLRQTTAQDFSFLGIATSVHLIPRTWPLQWSLQASLMRGTAQDFSSLPPATNPVYARYGAAHGIGMLSAIPGEIPS